MAPGRPTPRCSCPKDARDGQMLPATGDLWRIASAIGSPFVRGSGFAGGKPPEYLGGSTVEAVWLARGGHRRGDLFHLRGPAPALSRRGPDGAGVPIGQV